MSVLELDKIRKSLLWRNHNEKKNNKIKNKVVLFYKKIIVEEAI